METIDILGVPHAYDLTAPTKFPHVLVFVHGWLLSRKYWQPLIERLSSEYQCLAYDLRGFGDSQLAPGSTSDAIESPYSGSRSSHYSVTPSSLSTSNSTPCATTAHSPYSLAAYARDLAVLLKRLNIASAWLIGHSLGGSVAFWGAKQLPDCVRGIIGLNSGGGIYLKEEFERFRSAGQQMLKLRPRWLCHVPLIDLVFTRSHVARPVKRFWGRQRLIDLVTAHEEAALGTLLDSTTEAEVHRLPQLISQLQQPVYFIAGTQDKIMEPKYVRHLASFHPMFKGNGENVIEIPDCGHMAMVEQPDAIASPFRTILNNHL